MKTFRGNPKFNKKAKHIGLGDTFVPTEEQLLWDDYCINNDIRISPWPTTQGPNPSEWRIAISLGSDKKIYKTPTVYIVDNIWSELYNMKKYYYDKRKHEELRLL